MVALGGVKGIRDAPSLAGYQENFLASAEAVRDAGQVWPGTPGELRRRPEASESIKTRR